MKCFYHSADLDGHCSGAIIKRCYPDCELIGIDYGDSFPWDGIEPNENIFMVDFSLQPFEDMHKLAELASLTWVDHHRSAIKEHDENPLKHAFVVLGDGKGACELVWAFLYPDKSLPKTVYLLGRYDVWDHSDDRTLPFQYGARLRAPDPADDMKFWERAFVTFPKTVLYEGETILLYTKHDNAKYANACAFLVKLDGLYCVAINKMLTNSQLFDSVWDANVYDAMMTFGWRKGRWHISLYSDRDDIDVSTIAKAHGGGGHKGAAGFQCAELPFELKGKE